MSLLQTGTGSYTLNRWPSGASDPLRAWDAADEYLLQHVLDDQPPSADNSCRTLLINDAYGALATVLHEWKPQSWGDSFISFKAASENLENNNIDQKLRWLASTDMPTGPLDIVLIKVPKTTSLLEEQLFRLRDLCNANTRIIAAGMAKHLPASAFKAFEAYIGPVTTSLAKKKARLLFARFDAAITPPPIPDPCVYLDEDVGKPLINHANVFSRDHLDHGSRFLLQQFHRLPDVQTMMDLACGNGVLGLQYQRLHAKSSALFVDESYSAVKSARENHAVWFPHSAPPAEFSVSDGQTLQFDSPVRLILCNPPFHQQHAVGDQVARRLFSAAKRCLCQHGELWVVANRHLDYPAAMRQQFGNCSTVATNRKFSVYRAVRR